LYFLLVQVPSSLQPEVPVVISIWTLNVNEYATFCWGRPVVRGFFRVGDCHCLFHCPIVRV
jgi:hypothetical protein